jgi:hypothetical protein
MKKKWRLRQTEGQSLVEMALTLPLLLLMFAGLVEVGAALRNYLIVVNSNREGTRYAARGRWFDASHDPTSQDAQDIFGRVVASAGLEQRGEQWVPTLRTQDIGELPANATIAVTYFEIPAQFDRSGILDPQPALSFGTWYTGTGHVGESRIDVEAIKLQKQQDNLAFNQKYFIDEGLLDIPSDDNFIVVEVWFDHQQILGLPFFTELLPETITLYSQSTMRVTLDARVH